ncbi:MAG: hypothetical protein WD534_17395 [Phycisphaeraceae bacterium]
MVTKRAKPQAAKGITLIEVLAGLVLVAIVLPVAVRAIHIGTTTADMARHRLEAVSLAQSKLDELVATADWDAAGDTAVFDEPFERYTWMVEMDEFEGDVQTLTVDVSWQRRGETQSVRLSTLVDTGSE